MQRPLKIGTRGSPLALWQARRVQQLLGEAEGVSASDRDTAFPIVTFKTSGDKLTGHLRDFGGKGLFTKELETAQLSGAVDIAVHSMKDVPTQSQPGLSIAAILQRADPRDAFVSDHAKTLMDLPEGAVIGTASIRRRAQVLVLRPDVQFTLLRGNVGTRLAKMRNGDCVATFLACAGLNRLGQSDVITDAVSTNMMLPAPAQGAIGIECRTDDADTRARLSVLDHEASHWAITAERQFLRALDGSCRTPIAALAILSGSSLHFRGEVIAANASERFTCDTSIHCDSVTDAAALGYTLGCDIREQVGDRMLWSDTHTT